LNCGLATFEVVRQQRQQGQQGQNSAQQRQQRQLNQLDLQNRRTVIRTSGRRQQQQPQLNRQPTAAAEAGPAARDAAVPAACGVGAAPRKTFKHARCARRRASLQEAQEQPSARKPSGQLARLRDEQQQMLRDTMNCATGWMSRRSGSEQMADGGQQLDQTTNEVSAGGRGAGSRPGVQAAAAGQRASEQFKPIWQQEFRTAAARAVRPGDDADAR